MNIVESRKSNSIRNMIYAVGAYVITVVLAFIERKIFVAYLSEMFLGINGVMTNVLSILAISELGFGEAIMFSLYKPIRENDNSKIHALLLLYKKIYVILSVVIVVLGIAFSPFLPSFIKNVSISKAEIYSIYSLFIVSTLTSYFGAHRRSLIIAYQKRYVVSAMHCICRTLMYGMQIVLIIITQNYYLYLIITVLSAFAESLILFIIAEKKYPVVKRKDIICISKEEKKDIDKNILAMAMHKIGGTLVTSTDNLLISRMVGIIEVGLYSNYILLKTTIYTVTHSLFKAVVASMGDLGNERKEYSEKIFNAINYASGWLFGWCSICLLYLYDDFITIWLGRSFVLDRTTVILIVVSFYLTCMREPVIMTRDAFGLFWKDRWKPVAEALINLISSVLFAIKMGLSGIVLGTILSTLFTCFWIEPLVLYKYGFNKSCISYFVKYFLYLGSTLVGFFCTGVLCSLIRNISIVTFIYKTIICLIIPNAVYLVLTFKTDECKYLTNFIICRIRKLTGR